ncbi:MAG: hypothetical protein IJH96_04750 [Ruminococcus sp.]|nr:hypothetical protein [Ruminococcus sp.]
MNVNFKGFNENVITFIAAAGLTATGVPVKMSTDGAVTASGNGDPFIGVCVGLRNGYAAVQVSGYAELPAAAKITVGYQNLAVNSSGKVAANANGREYLVVDADADRVGVIL